MRTVLDYVLEHPVRVGRGTTVHQARRLPGDERVALKLATAGLPRDEVATVQLRLRREAAVLSAVTHPGLVPLVEVLDVPVAPGPMTGAVAAPAPTTEVAIVLAWARRGSLVDALAAGPIGPADALAMAHQLAGALAAVHAAGFVHGDLSPGNVLRADAVSWWLADLGEGRPLGAAPRVPRRGTDGFVAPEVLEGQPVDRSADVFALGSVIAAAIGPAGPIDDAILGPVRDLMHQATGTDADRRPSAADLERELERLAATGPPPPVRRPGPSRARAAVEIETRDLATPAILLPARGTGPAAGRERPRRRITALAAATTAVVLTAVLVLVTLHLASGARSEPSASADQATATELVDRAPCPGSSIDVPPGAVAVPGDPEGSGCTVAILWWPDRAEADRPDPDGSRHRFTMGRPGDQLLLGDWDGDGRDTPALYDPSAGTVTRFDGWAPTGASLTGAVVTPDAPVGGLARTDRGADPDVVAVDQLPAAP